MTRTLRHMTDRLVTFVVLGVRFGWWKTHLLRLHLPRWYEWPGPGTGDFCCERCGGHPYDFGR